MGNPWLRLDAHYSHHPKLVRAGPEATLLWPHVLAALKRSDGVCSDDDLDPAVLARICGGTVEQWTAGLDAIKRVGLLADGQRTVKVGRAPAEVVSGWVTPGWDKYQPDARPAGRERSKNVPGTNGTSPGQTERPSVSRLSPGGRVASSPVGLSDDALEEEEERAHEARKKQRPPNPLPGSGRAIDPTDVWQRIRGRGGMIPATLGRSSKVLPQEHLPLICDVNSVEDIEDAIASTAGANSPVPYFFALFDLDTGKRKAVKPATAASTTPAVAGEPIRRTAAEERQWQAFLVGEAARARGDEII
jgi:hypothetical protein